MIHIKKEVFLNEYNPNLGNLELLFKKLCQTGTVINSTRSSDSSNSETNK
jgi:hypothetical protein